MKYRLTDEELEAEFARCHARGMFANETARMLGVSVRLAMAGLARAKERRAHRQVAAKSCGCEHRVFEAMDSPHGPGFLGPTVEYTDRKYSPLSRAVQRYAEAVG